MDSHTLTIQNREIKKMENINYDLIGSIFMAVMFTNLIWNIQKKLINKLDK